MNGCSADQGDTRRVSENYLKKPLDAEGNLALQGVITGLK